jgi:hypothetical protein
MIEEEQAGDARRVRAGETILPSFLKSAFHCHVCQVFVRQLWQQLFTGQSKLVPVWRCNCTNCNARSYWYFVEGAQAQMVHPRTGSAPPPHPDMPENVRAEYQEAGEIIGISPRGAGALLRLALQKLMPHLGEKGKNLNEDIASLVQKGLDPQVQQSLDALRVIQQHSPSP